MPCFLSLQNIRNSADLLPDEPAEGKCRIQPREEQSSAVCAWEHSIPHTSAEIYFIHLLMPRASALPLKPLKDP